MGLWKVKKTQCYPHCWKIYPVSKYRESNNPRYYFRTKEDADMAIKRKNKEEKNGGK